MPKARKQDFSDAQLLAAIQEAQQGNSSVRSIAEKYGVPRSTLRFRLNNPGHKTTLGPETILTSKEENLLVHWILESARKGIPRKKDDVLDSVKQIITEHPRNHKTSAFKDNRPGDGWYKAFLKRHPQLTERKSEGVTKASSVVSEKNIRGWFNEVHEYFQEKQLNDVINDPERVFNTDETNFIICPTSGKVLAEKGARNVYFIEQGKAKESLTVLFTFSASGKVCRPMIVYPYQRVPEKVAQSVPESWGIGKSENGWMTAETFYEYVGNVFHPFLVENNVKLPVILYVDGHKTHLTYNLSVLCDKLQIEVIALYPNATRILQPADVAAFRPIKIGWRKYLRIWLNEHPNEVITKATFAPVLKEVLENCHNPDSLKNGFRVCGLCPFNPDAVDYSKCLGSSQNINLTRNIENNRVLTYEKFAEIVGNEQIETFKNMTLNEENNTQYNDLSILYRLYKEFLPETSAAVIQDNVVEIPNNGNNITTQEFGQDNNMQESTNHINTKSSDIFENNSMADHNYYAKPSTSKAGADILDPHELITVINTAAIKEPASTQVSISTNDDSIIGQYLSWPQTPKRKGKKVPSKGPYAVTSLKYRRDIEMKKQEKEKLLREKEERKKNREEKKIQKEEIKTKGKGKGKRSVKLEESTDKPTKKICILDNRVYAKAPCFICKRAEPDTELECTMCNKKFHIKCVPKGHRENIPDCPDIDLYVCHHCFKFNDESDDSVENLYNAYTEYQESYLGFSKRL